MEFEDKRALKTNDTLAEDQLNQKMEG